MVSGRERLNFSPIFGDEWINRREFSGGISSVGRASGWQPEGQGFESPILHLETQFRKAPWELLSWVFLRAGRQRIGNGAAASCFEVKRSAERIATDIVEDDDRLRQCQLGAATVSSTLLPVAPSAKAYASLGAHPQLSPVDVSQLHCRPQFSTIFASASCRRRTLAG